MSSRNRDADNPLRRRRRARRARIGRETAASIIFRVFRGAPTRVTPARYGETCWAVATANHSAIAACTTRSRNSKVSPLVAVTIGRGVWPRASDYARRGLRTRAAARSWLSARSRTSRVTRDFARTSLAWRMSTPRDDGLTTYKSPRRVGHDRVDMNRGLSRTTTAVAQPLPIRIT